MPLKHHQYTPAGHAVLQWLTDPGMAVPPAIRQLLLAELFRSPLAVLMGVLNSLIVETVGMCLSSPLMFGCLMLLEFALGFGRLAVALHAERAAARQAPTPTDACLYLAIGWCALQGALAFCSLQVRIPTLQVLGATTVMALIGPVCVRNHAAPRLAVLLVCLLTLPFVIGASLSGDHWLILLLAETPLFLLGTMTVIRRFHAMSLAALTAQHKSDIRARHDPLTGLLNRAGLEEHLAELEADATCRLVVFYLDLDNFKKVNDTLGHPAGDRLLAEVARRLQSVARSGETTARLGGDEFALVAHGMLPEAAHRFGARVIEQVAQPYDLGEYGPARIGVSVGFACRPEESLVMDELRHMADAALYQAKAAGKGVVRRYHPPEHAPTDRRISRAA